MDSRALPDATFSIALKYAGVIMAWETLKINNENNLIMCISICLRIFRASLGWKSVVTLVKYLLFHF